jgi:hypothetical protein
MRRKYNRMHIPGGCTCACQERVVSEGLSECVTVNDFLRWLNSCNRSGMGHWQYWSDDL